MFRLVDASYVVAGIVTVRQGNRPALIVTLQVFRLALLNATAGTCGGYMFKEKTANLCCASFYKYITWPKQCFPATSTTVVVCSKIFSTTHVSRPFSPPENPPELFVKIESPWIPIFDELAEITPASINETTVDGCLKITTFWCMLIAEDVSHNKISLSGEREEI